MDFWPKSCMHVDVDWLNRAGVSANGVENASTVSHISAQLFGGRPSARACVLPMVLGTGRLPARTGGVVAMSADPIVYCLERLTDDAQFERLATGLMAGTDFAGTEPLGGSGDGGRDALHVHREEGTVRVFAYSVRHDWETKLRQDCRRIAAAKHRLDEVVFVSTRAMSVQKREDHRTEGRDTHGWETEFYDIERLRALLTGPLASLIGQHPSIFVPPWFERRGGEVVSHKFRDREPLRLRSEIESLIESRLYVYIQRKLFRGEPFEKLDPRRDPS